MGQKRCNRLMFSQMSGGFEAVSKKSKSDNDRPNRGDENGQGAHASRLTAEKQD